MRLLAVVMSVAVVAGGVVWAQTQRTTSEPKTGVTGSGTRDSGSGIGAPAQSRVTADVTASVSASSAVDKGARWLVSVQGADGGWGQDGGEVSSVRTGERLESSGNDVANTAV